MVDTDERALVARDVPVTDRTIRELGDVGEHPSFDELADAIERSTLRGRNLAASHVNIDSLATYWNNGRMIVVYEQDGCDRARYGDKTLLKLSKRLTDRMGRGFSRTNLYNMRQFYLDHEIFQSVTGKLTWTHYCELMGVRDDLKRSFYEREAANSGWSVRELRRQMDSMLFERLLSAGDGATRERVLALASEGVSYQRPADIVKEPVTLEFLDLPVEEPPLESDLQRALVSQIERFMLELGRGFMFVGSNYRIPVGTDKDFADMVFYCKPLRAYVLIEPKTTRLMASAVGQVNEYLNYFAAEVSGGCPTTGRTGGWTSSSTTTCAASCCSTSRRGGWTHTMSGRWTSTSTSLMTSASCPGTNPR